MIEMLGVLAIIGVLSAGGIMGYSVAMENYKVNKYIDMMTKGAASARTLFKNRKAGYLTTQISKLCVLGIVPEDICNTREDVYYRTGYFGETIAIMLNEQSATFDLNEYTFKNGKVVIGMSPIKQLYWIIFSKIPVSTCVKLLSHPAWNDVEIMPSVAGLGSLGHSQLPISVDMAERYCKEEMALSEIRINITIELEKFSYREK